jgi:hypothetical protein
MVKSIEMSCSASFFEAWNLKPLALAVIVVLPGSSEELLRIMLLTVLAWIPSFSCNGCRYTQTSSGRDFAVAMGINPDRYTATGAFTVNARKLIMPRSVNLSKDGNVKLPSSLETAAAVSTNTVPMFVDETKYWRTTEQPCQPTKPPVGGEPVLIIGRKAVVGSSIRFTWPLNDGIVTGWVGGGGEPGGFEPGGLVATSVSLLYLYGQSATLSYAPSFLSIVQGVAHVLSPCTFRQMLSPSLGQKPRLPTYVRHVFATGSPFPYSIAEEGWKRSHFGGYNKDQN